MKNLTENNCELCNRHDGDVLWQDEFCRIVAVREPAYPGFCRIILQRHVKEMTDLAPQDRARLMNVVFAVEAALRELMQPDKINLASLGNAVPHLHWHVIPRHSDDSHFPGPIWAQALRPQARARPGPERGQLVRSLAARLGEPR